jgi:hypothetical protein
VSESRLGTHLKSAAGAFALAVLTWVGVNFVTSFERAVEDVELDLRLPEGWAVEDVSQDRFTVWFRGSREDVAQLTAGSVKVELDLRARTAQELVVEVLTSRHVRASGAARVYRIQPELVKIRLDPAVSKAVPIRPQVTGTLPDGYKMDSAVSVPETVTLFGSRRRLEEIRFVQTAPVDLNGRIQSFEANVDVAAPAPALVERVEPRRIKVAVSISSRFLRKELERVPIRLLLPPELPSTAVRLEPEHISLRLEGGDEVFRDFGPEKVLAFVAPTGTVTAPVRIPVQVRLPTGMSLLDFSPKAVTLLPAPPPASPATP